MTKIYEVAGYWPEKHEHGGIIRGGRYIGAFVECVNASRAAEIVETKYPGITIESIVRKGSREIIVDTTEGETP